MASPERPLSPHLQVYKPQLTSVLSILHRVTGVALTAGTSSSHLVAGLRRLWSRCLCNCAGVRGIIDRSTDPVGFTFALFYHLGNGVRHLAWISAGVLNSRSCEPRHHHGCLRGWCHSRHLDRRLRGWRLSHADALFIGPRPRPRFRQASATGGPNASPPSRWCRSPSGSSSVSSR